MPIGKIWLTAERKYRLKVALVLVIIFVLSDVLLALLNNYDIITPGWFVVGLLIAQVCVALASSIVSGRFSRKFPKVD